MTDRILPAPMVLPEKCGTVFGQEVRSEQKSETYEQSNNRNRCSQVPILNNSNNLVNLIEVSGYIKWFDITKGYGFIVSDKAELGDVLLHVSVLQRSGFQLAQEGARIACAARKGANGFQAIHVHMLDLSTATQVTQTSPRRYENIEPRSGLERALVKWFNRTKGFGFLSRGMGTEDIFIHMEVLRRYGLTELNPGQVVLVRYGLSKQGLMAVEIHPDNPLPFMTTH